MSGRRLEQGFLRSWERFPNRPALAVAGETLTYEQLGERAASIAATLDAGATGDGPPLTAVFGHRSATVYAGILGSLFHGHGYVPLSPRLPVERTREMLRRSHCTSLIVDAAAAPQLDAVLEGLERPATILLPDARLVPADRWTPSAAVPDRPVYLLFTSGSTGRPKGVPVSDANIAALVDFAVERYDIHEDDRCSQMFELTFDPSAWDLFVTWERGACLCCPTPAEVIKPDGFIDRSGLTVWFSVASLAQLMDGLGLLHPGRFPSLRWSLLCGEALPLSLAETWAAAAPNSTVENVYGPTELTIVSATYRLDETRTPYECDAGIVPIGEPPRGMTALVVDDALREVPDGVVGELLMTGPQLTAGYWDDPQRTALSYVVPPGREEVFYRTGDLVRRVGGGPLRFHGRKDDQIKVHGHRVELGEIEAVLREAAGGGTAVAAVGWPATAAGASAIAAFATGRVDLRRLRRCAGERLPDYMVPRRYELLRELPVNPHGKTDRRALAALLEERP